MWLYNKFVMDGFCNQPNSTSLQHSKSFYFFISFYCQISTYADKHSIII